MAAQNSEGSVPRNPAIERYLKEVDSQKEFLATSNREKDIKQETTTQASENADRTLAEISKHMEEHQSTPRP